MPQLATPADALEQLFRGVTSRAEFRLSTLTEPELLPSSESGVPRPDGLAGLRKRCVLKVTLGQSYADAVNEQRLREGLEPDFVPTRRKGPERVGDTPLRVGKEGLLLEAIVRECESVAFELPDGRVVDRPDVEPWLKPSYDVGAHQGLAVGVVYRTFKLSSIEAAGPI